MLWISYAFLSAAIGAGLSLIEKKILNKAHAMEFSATLGIINLLLVLPLAFFIDFSSLNPIAVLLILAVTIIASSAYLLSMKALRHSEVSSISPFFVMQPGLVAIMAFFVLGEKLNLLQILGLSFFIIGSFILEARDHGKFSFIGFFRNIKASKYLHYVFYALILYSVSALMDRFIITTYDMSPMPYFFLAHIFTGINFFVAHSIFHDGYKGVANGIKTYKWWILLLAALTLSQRFFWVLAVKYTTHVGIASAIKRLSPFFVVMIGGEIFHEHNLRQKAVACLVMFIGAVLVVI